MSARVRVARSCAIVLASLGAGCGGAEVHTTTPASSAAAPSAAQRAADRLLDAFPVACVFPEEPSESISWLIEEGDLGDGFLGDTDPMPPIEAFRSVDGQVELQRRHAATSIRASLTWNGADRQPRRASYDEVGTERSIGRLETLIAIDSSRIVGWFCDKPFGVAARCRYGIVSVAADSATRLSGGDLAPVRDSISVARGGDRMFVAARLESTDVGSPAGAGPIVVDAIDLRHGSVERMRTSLVAPDVYYGVVASDAGPAIVLPDATTGDLVVFDAAGHEESRIAPDATGACDARETPRARVRLPLLLGLELGVSVDEFADGSELASMGLRANRMCDLALEIEFVNGGSGSYEGAVAMRVDPAALGTSWLHFVAGREEVRCDAE